MTMRRTTSSRCSPTRVLPCVRAFTLLELVVTLVIFTMLMGMVMQIYHSSVNARQRVADATTVIEEADGVMRIVVDDLQRIHAYDDRAYLMVENQQIGDAEATSVAFPSATTVRLNESLRDRPGLIEIAYLVGPDPDHEGYMRLFRRELEAETDTDATWIRQSDDGLVLLATSLTAFSMEFLSAEELATAQENQTEPQWVTRWDSGFATDDAPLPAAIRVTVGVQRPEGGEMTLTRTVRLPTKDPNAETLQPELEKALGIESS